MRVFLSHTSRDKPLLREVCRQLPSQVRTWLDEDTLLLGDDIETSLRSAIELESDLVLVFVGLEAARSKWVRKALEWAIEREKDLGHIFVVPVVMDEYAWKVLEPAKFRERKYLLCTDFSEPGVTAFAEKLKGALLAWQSRQLEKSSSKADTPKKADALKKADTAKEADAPKKIAAPKKVDAPKVVVEAVGVDLPTGALDALRAQGASLATIEAARKLLGDVPEHGLVVRARNEGNRAVNLTVYGILARQTGKKSYRGHPHAPTAAEMPLVTLNPGSDHEFVTDLELLAKALKNPSYNYHGSVEIRGFYDTSEGAQYRSDPVILNVETYALEGG